MDTRLPTINTLDESGVLGTPTTRIRRMTDGTHWSMPDHVCGEATAVGMSASQPDHDDNYETDFEIWRENKEFEHQNISMGRPPLELTRIGTDTTNEKRSHLESTPVGTKMPDPKPLTRPTESLKRNGKEHVPEDLESDPSPSD